MKFDLRSSMAARTLLRIFAFSCLRPLSAAPSSAPSSAPSPSPRPNVVLILIDDLGIRDLTCYGSSFHRTPHIDALAAAGVRFADAYAAHPRCVPARVGLFTGVYPARFGSPPDARFEREYPDAHRCHAESFLNTSAIPRSNFTSLGEAFREGGYRTGYVGKWHLGNVPSHRGTPADHGFEVGVGASDAGAVDSHFYPFVSEDNRKGFGKLPNLTGAAEGDYLTDHLTKETNALIRKFKNDPFFIVLSHYAVHVPLQAKPHLVAKYVREREKLPHVDRSALDSGAYYRTSQDNAVYAAMVESVDQSVGRVRRQLRELGLDRDTVVVLTSDNGGHANRPLRYIPKVGTSNRPYRHGKRWLYEGGVRVPLIVFAPHVDLPRKVSRAPTIGTDLYPTLLQLAGLPLRPGDHVDGRSLVPALKAARDDPFPVRPFFWTGIGKPGTPRGALRRGQWKMVHAHDGAVELYHLFADPYEKNDRGRVARLRPLRRRLFAAYNRWRSTLVRNEDFVGRCRYANATLEGGG